MENTNHTLAYARCTLGIGCMRFKHGGIRMDTARQKNFLSMLKNFVRMRTYGLYVTILIKARLHGRSLLRFSCDFLLLEDVKE